MSRYEVYGAIGSPYSMKVRAALRAKRLTHTWTGMTAEDRMEVMPNVRAPVIPVVRRPDGTWANDSTPFLLSIETEGRPLLPPDPTARFACLILEDMADEWFMKAMFHYRWAYAEDAEWCANWLMFDSLPNAGVSNVETAAADIRARQIERMALVGCTPATAPLIETSWKRACKALDAMATGPTRFLFGDCPSLADLGFYGQLKVMSSDPTPMAWLRSEVPYLYRWLDHADDASGIEGNWVTDENNAPSAPLQTLLGMVGDTYLPFLKANAVAVEAGHDTFSLNIEGGRYEQGVFKYQLKCLLGLRTEWSKLDRSTQSRLCNWIGTGADILNG